LKSWLEESREFFLKLGFIKVIAIYANEAKTSIWHTNGFFLVGRLFTHGCIVPP
jgi:hypothetical protein